jgi:hypothetical protein
VLNNLKHNSQDCSTLITAEVNLSPYVTCTNIECCVLDCSTLITAEVNLSPYVTCPNIGKSQTEMTVKVSERNLDPMLGQAQKCDRVKLIIRIITVTPLYI